MALHDWDQQTGWEGVHHFWITHLVPTMPLPLTVHTAIPIDLEATYQQAAADAYFV